VTALEPWRAPRNYLNFREIAVSAERLFDATDLAALRAVRDD
jgi:hypothetical protein